MKYTYSFDSRNGSLVSAFAELVDSLMQPAVFADKYPDGYFPESLLPAPKAILTEYLQRQKDVIHPESLGWVRLARLKAALQWFVPK